MPTDRYAARRDRLLRRLKPAGLAAFLVTSPVNVRYLSGFTGEDSYLLVTRTGSVLISDSRFETQLAEECPGLNIDIRDRTTSMSQAAVGAIERTRADAVAFESMTTTYAQWESIAGELRSAQLVPTTGEVEALRMIKDADEIASIREAVRQAEKGFAVLRSSLRPDMTERDAAHDLEQAMRRFGAKGASFETIIAAGPRAALPHARPTAAKIDGADFVLVDWGAVNAEGYHSDLTRLLATGTISTKLEKLYRVVLTAQQRAIEAIRPGILCGDVDQVARQAIAKAGFGKHFGHGLGHGIGLEIHEMPRVSQNSQTELRPGMVVTVEPGVYLPGWGGIRIEDDVLVTRTGHLVLSSLSRDLDAMVVG